MAAEENVRADVTAPNFFHVPVEEMVNWRDLHPEAHAGEIQGPEIIDWKKAKGGSDAKDVQNRNKCANENYPTEEAAAGAGFIRGFLHEPKLVASCPDGEQFDGPP